MEINLNSLLSSITKQLAFYLDKHLPKFTSDWWNECVLKQLSEFQRKQVKNKNIKSLSELDLAALLKIFDRNWFNLFEILNLTIEDRNYTKEMMSIRNRWAHLNSTGIDQDDIYRDTDTIQRFAKIISADDELKNQIKEIKNRLLDYKLHVSESTGINNDSKPGSINQNFSFWLGQIVCLKSNPEVKGAVVNILEGNPENRYLIFIDGSTQTLYESQIVAAADEESKLWYIQSEEFHSYLSALQIRFPGLSTLYSLNAARVDFIPYQFRPVLKFIRSDRPRLLIADGVGVGKTIEAGLILRELQARRDVQSVLIICPRPLVTEKKWEREMKRFEENFIPLDSKTLKYCINEMDLEGEWPDRYQKAIIPYSLFDETRLYGNNRIGKQRPEKGLLDLDPPPRFDLIIVDEAHHIRNQDTYRHQAVKFFCENADAAVFLTATPIQLGEQDLYVLLNTLRPDLVIDRDSFEHMAEPNPYINQTINLVRSQRDGWQDLCLEALSSAAATLWGQTFLKQNPKFIKALSLISENDLSNENRIELIRNLEDLHSFSGIINRTRRRDIGDFTIRKPETVTVDFTESQKVIYNELINIQATIFSKLHGQNNVNFMLTTIRRQASSCLFGLAPFLYDILNRHLDELEWAESDSSEVIPSEDSIEVIEERINKILEKIKKLDSFDPKLEALRKILVDKQKLPNNKVILFSSFRHTLKYLNEHLKVHGFRVGMVHGGTPDDLRNELRNRFELPRENEDCLDILLFSEIGSEGLDYQFCDCIINYDLPWNPMKIEQRIGRIDRRGQRSESVAIFNMITPGTVDADIYLKCMIRIGIFDRALGGSEEILGEIAQGIRNIAENFTLSDEDRKIQLQQLADNKIRLIKEQEDLEEKQAELFGIRLPHDQINNDIDAASSYWLSPESIQRLVKKYLSKVCGEDQEYILGEKSLKTLRLSEELRNRLLSDFKNIKRLNNPTYKEWERWLKGNNPHLSVTFEAELASKHPKSHFIMPLHPLVKQASNELNTNRKIVTSFYIQDNSIAKDVYEFAIYKWQFYGLRKDMVFQPVAVSKEITNKLLNLIINAQEGSLKDIESSDKKVWERLDSEHHKLWRQAKADHQNKTKELVEYRRESLTTSHKARIAILHEHLRKANNEKIQIMRQSQIDSAEADYSRRIQELDIAVERADITSEPIAYGIIKNK